MAFAFLLLIATIFGIIVTFSCGSDQNDAREARWQTRIQMFHRNNVRDMGIVLSRTFAAANVPLPTQLRNSGSNDDSYGSLGSIESSGRDGS